MPALTKTLPVLALALLTAASHSCLLAEVAERYTELRPLAGSPGAGTAESRKAWLALFHSEVKMEPPETPVTVAE